MSLRFYTRTKMYSTHSTVFLTSSASIIVSILFPFAVSLPAGLYDFPSPRIEVFKNGGFKVSVPDEDGLSLFAFHGNINRPLRNLEAGQFSVDITKKENNRWTYENSDLKLKRGDVINYWLYVIKNGLGYQLLDKQYTVEDYTDESSCTVAYNTAIADCKDQLKSLEACMKIQSNILDSLVISQSELVRLHKLVNPKLNVDNNNVRLLPSSDQPEGVSLGPIPTIPTTTSKPLHNVSTYKHALLMGGNLPIVQPSQKNYIQFINFILWEKLELNNIEAVSVTLQDDDTYVFDLRSGKEKQQVLDASKIKLLDSTIFIRNFEK